MRKNGVNIVTTQTCAIILAAGQGTRMKSKHPKAMCEVLDRSLVKAAPFTAEDLLHTMVHNIVAEGKESK